MGPCHKPIGKKLDRRIDVINAGLMALVGLCCCDLVSSIKLNQWGVLLIAHGLHKQKGLDLVVLRALKTRVNRVMQLCASAMRSRSGKLNGSVRTALGDMALHCVC